MPLGAWLASLVPGLVARVLAALGFGIVTMTGLNTVADTLLNHLYTSYNSIGVSTLQLMNLAGFGEGLNIIIGAITARISLYVLTKSSRIIGIGS